MKDKLSLKKNYYFECLHWTIKLCIYQIRKKNYPLDYWYKNLKDTLKQKNDLAKKINNFKPNQLTLF
jgi:hypothetical protein